MNALLQQTAEDLDAVLALNTKVTKDIIIYPVGLSKAGKATPEVAFNVPSSFFFFFSFFFGGGGGSFFYNFYNNDVNLQ